MTLFRVIDTQTGREADPGAAACDMSRAHEGRLYGGQLLRWWENGCKWAVDQHGNLLVTDGCGDYEIPADGRYEVVWERGDGE